VNNETRQPVKIIYARVSTDDKNQDVNNQRTAIINAGHTDAKIMFSDETSGTVAPMKRDGFSRMMNVLRAGDTIVITALDRLTRSTVDGLSLVKELNERGITVISLRESEILTGTADGKFRVGIALLLAERERDVTSERVKQGLEHARARGKTLGRPPVNGEQIETARRMFAEGAKPAAVMAATGLSRASVYRIKSAAE